MTISAREASSAASVYCSALADGEIAWVAIDRAQRLVDGACGVSPDKILIAAETFQPAMEPLRPIRIGVTVGNESAVLERYGIIHQCTQQGEGRAG